MVVKPPVTEKKLPELSNISATPSALAFPRRVRVVEVGPRDGLQNERILVPAHVKVQLVRDLVRAGLITVECTAFVSHKRVPQLADAAHVMTKLSTSPSEKDNTTFVACVPNLRGLKDALRCGTKEIAILVAATDEFSVRNIGCNIEDSLVRYQQLIAHALEHGVKVRAYISCAFGCPYTGNVPVRTVCTVARRLLTMGAYQVALGDTIGAGNPRTVVSTISACIHSGIDVGDIGVHFHDTRGTALANVLAALSLGVSTVDSSIAGLGGCPFAPGAAGNLATEDLVHMLQAMNIDIGDYNNSNSVNENSVNLEQLVDIGNAMCRRLGCENRSKVAKSFQSMNEFEKINAKANNNNTINNINNNTINTTLNNNNTSAPTKEPATTEKVAATPPSPRTNTEQI